MHIKADPDGKETADRDNNELTEGRRDRREALLSAAIDLFAERAYENVSVDEICARACVAHGLLSYHFGGKRGLFAAAVSRVWKDLTSFEKPQEFETTVAERFHGYLSRHFAYIRAHPARFRLMMRTAHADKEISEILRSTRRGAIREIEAALGCPEGASPRLAMAIAGWADFVDTVTLDYVEDSSFSVADITDMCAQVLVASVRSASDMRVDAAVELETLARVTSPELWI
ncbi:TetR/AcrR family transcriptional regulator [Rhodococcus wratislaviensis]|uniref:TetR/AcrR family transcriptional regulator n=1 Tax=Rhodococcus wratislaviensis TaxID=44752 RepID=UPI003660B9B2